MNRAFKTVDDEAILERTIRLGDGVPPTALARFLVETIAHLDLSVFYAHYGTRDGQPWTPAILLLLSRCMHQLCSLDNAYPGSAAILAASERAG